MLVFAFMDLEFFTSQLRIVGEMSADQRKVLLFFWTSVKYLPVEGFRGLASRLYIYKSTEPEDHLPSSHTCFYRLCFPPYPSMAIMQDRLRVITQEHEAQTHQLDTIFGPTLSVSCMNGIGSHLA
ncbi:unnamed protein product [Dovyalis caffra]|uniref:HECT-type E3 ubiquitin transferase n=1 Tax=Dovyalis caffra TaxID=77055 RepID=A0AAV1S3D7_9ROSI|nr:unnamed protein product [Dovyalis caffra]